MNTSSSVTYVFARLDAYGTDDPGFNEGHPEDRCPLCEWPVCDHPGQPGYDDLPPRAKWPHRRATLRELIARRVGRFLDRLWWQM